MITTVTTTTVTTIVTTTVALASSLIVITVVALLMFLILKEVLSGSANARAIAMQRVLNIAIVPLLLSFGFILVVKVSEVLR
jgi:hypothetical protein